MRDRARDAGERVLDPGPVWGWEAGPGGAQQRLPRAADFAVQQEALAPCRGLLGGGANHSASTRPGGVPDAWAKASQAPWTLKAA